MINHNHAIQNYCTYAAPIAFSNLTFNMEMFYFIPCWDFIKTKIDVLNVSQGDTKHSTLEFTVTAVCQSDEADLRPTNLFETSVLCLIAIRWPICPPSLIKQ